MSLLVSLCQCHEQQNHLYNGKENVSALIAFENLLSFNEEMFLSSISFIDENIKILESPKNSPNYIRCV